MAAICCLSMAFTCVAVILGMFSGYVSVWGWRGIGEDYVIMIFIGLILGLLTSLPVMIAGLVVSERHAFLAVVLGSVAAGTICGLVCRIICWAFLHIT
jgi:hypothetical protein